MEPRSTIINRTYLILSGDLFRDLHDTNCYQLEFIHVQTAIYIDFHSCDQRCMTAHNLLVSQCMAIGYTVADYAHDWVMVVCLRLFHD